MKTITPKDCMRIIRKKPLVKSLQNGFIASGWADHLPAVYARSSELFACHADAGRAKMIHLEQLLPMIAFYEETRKITGSREAALAFFERWAFVEAEKMMKFARAAMKTGLYRLMPSLCGFMLDRMFGRAAGFDYRAVPGGRKFSVDMTRCPYVDTCLQHGCPELTQFTSGL